MADGRFRGRILWAVIISGVVAGPLVAGEIEELYRKWVRPRNAETAPQQLRFERLQNPQHGVTEIGLERTACFGTCPVYSVVLKSDGTVRYFGNENVPFEGVREGEISVTEFHQLAEFLIESGYLSLSTEYPSGVTDLPSAYTTAVVRGKRKVIQNTGGLGPVKLWALEQAIDAVVAGAQWGDLKLKRQSEDGLEGPSLEKPGKP